MSEVEPDLRRVVFEVRPEHLGELFQCVAGFATEHALTIHVNDTDATESSIEVEAAQIYNPAWVNLVQDATGETVPIINGEHLRRFSLLRTGKTNNGSRLGTALLSRKPRTLGILGPYLATDTKGDILGLRANHVPTILRGLQQETLGISQITAAQIELFADFANAIIAPDDDPATP